MRGYRTRGIPCFYVSHGIRSGIPTRQSISNIGSLSSPERARR